MNVRDIAGIFSRSFIVGYFAPALIAWTTAILLTRGGQPERFEQLGFRAQVVVVLVLSALVAALLSALRYEIRSAFSEGRLVPASLRTRMRARERKRFKALRPENPEQLARRGDLFPDDVKEVRPTRFGNAVGAYQAYPATRFGLEHRVAWKRIDVLLSPREVELQALARSDVDAFLNLSVLAPIAAVEVLVERLVYPSPVAAASVALLFFSYVFYRLAVRAERRLGHEQRASFDLHRLELYEQFGLRRPASPAEEKSAAQWLSTIMLWPTFEIPAELWKVEKESKAEKES